MLTWREVTSLTIGHFNPSQVGTSIASKRSFQRHFPKRKCWAAVRKWHFEQSGQCAKCGTRLELQADHAIPKQIVGDVGEMVRTSVRDIGKVSKLRLVKLADAKLVAALEANGTLGETSEKHRLAIAADLASLLKAGEKGNEALSEAADCLDNMILRCRRCNVVRRPSHAKGGKTFLTAEAALMWLLLVKRPATYDEFKKLCREYGLTMADIRFEEAWAMARWLERVGKYEIDPTSKYSP